MHDDERFFLLLEMLDGDKHAHKVLADLLEERGERGLAQWARARKIRSTKRLQFALALIPSRLGVPLACDFVEHALEQRRQFEERDASRTDVVLNVVARLREAVCNEQLREQTAAICGSLAELPGTSTLHFAAASLSSAVRAALEADRCKSFAQSRHLEEQSRLFVRRTAKEAAKLAWYDQDSESKRRLRRWLGTAFGDGLIYDPHSTAKELRWQIERTKEILEQVENAEQASRLSAIQ